MGGGNEQQADEENVNPAELYDTTIYEELTAENKTKAERLVVNFGKFWRYLSRQESKEEGGEIIFAGRRMNKHKRSGVGKRKMTVEFEGENFTLKFKGREIAGSLTDPKGAKFIF